MSLRVPPLNSLRAFEATARHLSFTKAADELYVTPAALSHQIKSLEEFLSLRLFDRRTRRIELTAAGKQLYPGLHAAFAQIRQAIASLEFVNNDRVLVVSAPPGITAKWLAPRLYRFLLANPDIDTRISATMTIANFVTDGVDVAIRHTRTNQPHDPDLLIEWLVDIELVAVCSPKLCKQGLRTPHDLRRFNLVHDDSLLTKADLPVWTDWLSAAGIDGVDVSRGLRFSSADHAVDATAEGAGVLLANTLMAHDDLKSGRLVAPFELTLKTGRAIHFVCPRGSESRPKVQAFRAWLHEEVRQLDLRLRPARPLRRHKLEARG